MASGSGSAGSGGAGRGVADCCFADGPIRVDGGRVRYSEEYIEADYTYEESDVSVGEDGGVRVSPRVEKLQLRTEVRVPRVGVLLVGWGGNNGTTVTAALLAHRRGVEWHSRRGAHTPNWRGSLTQASTVRLGATSGGRDVFVPLRRLLPMARPEDLVLGGWDISGMRLGDAMRRAQVLPYDLQRQLYEELQTLQPMAAALDPAFIAANQSDRADNVISGTKGAQLAQLRADIRAFRARSGVDKVVVLWTANTERFCAVAEGLNDTAENLLASIARDEAEVAPSQLYAVAAVLEGCSYINGSPQNTFVPGVLELAQRQGVFVGGDDFKSGQTKMKSALVDFLVSAGIKVESIASYNHLGNNDGKNLSAPQQFRSKEISKSNVVDDMVASNRLLYAEGEHPDHCVVIKYVPHVGDSKRALDEYSCSIFMGGEQTIVLHNTCEDSLLAAPLIIDLLILTELFERIRIRRISSSASVDASSSSSSSSSFSSASSSTEGWEKFDTVLSLLAYLLKAPLVPPGTPVVNSLFRQREAIVNVLRACIGLAPESHLMLQHRLAGAGSLAVARATAMTAEDWARERTVAALAEAAEAAKSAKGSGAASGGGGAAASSSSSSSSSVAVAAATAAVLKELAIPSPAAASSASAIVVGGPSSPDPDAKQSEDVA